MFKYNCKDKNEILFFRSTPKNIYINKPKKINDLINSKEFIKENIIIDCIPTPHQYIKKVALKLRDKLYDKSEGSISLKYKYINHKVFEFDFFMSKEFIFYLDDYLRARINYGFNIIYK